MAQISGIIWDPRPLFEIGGASLNRGVIVGVTAYDVLFVRRPLFECGGVSFDRRPLCDVCGDLCANYWCSGCPRFVCNDCIYDNGRLCVQCYFPPEDEWIEQGNDTFELSDMYESIMTVHMSKLDTLDTVVVSSKQLVILHDTEELIVDAVMFRLNASDTASFSSNQSMESYCSGSVRSGQTTLSGSLIFTPGLSPSQYGYQGAGRGVRRRGYN